MPIATIIALLLSHVGDIAALASEVETAVTAVAHGEGGAEKIANAAAAAAAISTTVSNVASAVQSGTVAQPAVGTTTTITVPKAA